MRLALTLSLLALIPMRTACADDNIIVYQLAGTVQCSQDPGIAPDKGADLLRGQGVKVVFTQRRMLPVRVIARCGAPTGEVNLMEVPAADWAVFSAQNPDGGGYGIWVFERPTVEVYRYDGTLQCGLGKERPMAAMAEELGAAGIEVLASRKAKDGLEHIAVCGASTGAINVYTIAQADLAVAESMGFDVLVTRELVEGIKPQAKAQDEPRAPPPGSAAAPAPASLSERTPLLW